ncbi:unnamed protein product, partial [Lymnaea stagnalis]
DNLARAQAFQLLKSQRLTADSGPVSGTDHFKSALNISNQTKLYLTAMLSQVSSLSHEQIATFLCVPYTTSQLVSKFKEMRNAELNAPKQTNQGIKFKKGEVITLDEDDAKDTPADTVESFVILDSDEEQQNGTDEVIKGKAVDSHWNEYDGGDVEFWSSASPSQTTVNKSGKDRAVGEPKTETEIIADKDHSNGKVADKDNSNGMVADKDNSNRKVADKDNSNGKAADKDNSNGKALVSEISVAVCEVEAQGKDFKNIGEKKEDSIKSGHSLAEDAKESNLNLDQRDSIKSGHSLAEDAKESNLNLDQRDSVIINTKETDKSSDVEIAMNPKVTDGSSEDTEVAMNPKVTDGSSEDMEVAMNPKVTDGSSEDKEIAMNPKESDKSFEDTEVAISPKETVKSLEDKEIAMNPKKTDTSLKHTEKAMNSKVTDGSLEEKEMIMNLKESQHEKKLSSPCVTPMLCSDESSNDSDDVICIESESAEPKKLQKYLSLPASGDPVVTRSVTFMSNNTSEPQYVSAKVGFTNWGPLLHFNFTGDPSHLPTAMFVAEGRSSAENAEAQKPTAYVRLYPPVQSLIPKPNSRGVTIRQRLKELPCLSTAYLKVTTRPGQSWGQPSSSGVKQRQQPSGQTLFPTQATCWARPQNSGKISISLNNSEGLSQSTHFPPCGFSKINFLELQSYLCLYQCRSEPAEPNTHRSTPSEPAEPNAYKSKPSEPAEPNAHKSTPSEPAEPNAHKSTPSEPAEPNVHRSTPSEPAVPNAHRSTSSEPGQPNAAHRNTPSDLPEPNTHINCIPQMKLQDFSDTVQKIVSLLKPDSMDTDKDIKNFISTEECHQGTLDALSSDFHMTLSELVSRMGSSADTELAWLGHLLSKPESRTDGPKQILPDSLNKLTSFQLQLLKNRYWFLNSHLNSERKQILVNLDDCEKKDEVAERWAKEDSRITGTSHDTRSENSGQSHEDMSDSAVGVEVDLREKILKRQKDHSDQENEPKGKKLKPDESAAESTSTDYCADLRPNPPVTDNTSLGFTNESALSTSREKTHQHDAKCLGKFSEKEDAVMEVNSSEKACMKRNSSESSECNICSQTKGECSKPHSGLFKESEINNSALNESCIILDSSAMNESCVILDNSFENGANHVVSVPNSSVSESCLTDGNQIKILETGGCKQTTNPAVEKPEKVPVQNEDMKESLHICISSSSDEDGSKSHRDRSRAENFHPYSVVDDAQPDALIMDNTSDGDESADERWKHKQRWQPCLKKDPYPAKESLHLMLEEAFFLSYGLGCLRILDPEMKVLSLTEMWQKFQILKDEFIPHYVAYHYFRSKGWVPKSGLKFGCDLILYKEGPPFFHGSYSVIVSSVKEKSVLPCTRSDGFNFDQRQANWIYLAGVNRITEQVAKNLMMCYVI